MGANKEQNPQKAKRCTPDLEVPDMTLRGIPGFSLPLLSWHLSGEYSGMDNSLFHSVAAAWTLIEKTGVGKSARA